jgi:hypothetical protein
MPNRCWLRYFGLRNTSQPNRKSNLEAQQPLTVSRCQTGNRSAGGHQRGEVLYLRVVLGCWRPLVHDAFQVVGVQAFGVARRRRSYSGVLGSMNASLGAREAVRVRDQRDTRSLVRYD